MDQKRPVGEPKRVEEPVQHVCFWDEIVDHGNVDATDLERIERRDLALEPAPFGLGATQIQNGPDFEAANDRTEFSYR